MPKKRKLPEWKHKNPLTGNLCVYDPECPVCEERDDPVRWNKLIALEKSKEIT